MRYSKTILTTVFIALIMSVTGCGDAFFTRPPQGQLTADNFYNSEQDLRRATGALYNQVWFDWNNTASFVIGDSRAGNMWSTDTGYSQFIEFAITSENGQLSSGWRSLYLAINQANLVIQNIRNQAGGNISEEAINQALAEARFIRGYAYTYLAQLWGAVPVVTNTPRLIDQPEQPRIRRQDVLEFAINDFEFAAEHLPPTAEQAGRVTEWSAKGMLARTYWTRATFNDMDQEYLMQARNYAREVITQSGMSLRENFGDLFILQQEEQNNTQESLFSLQWTYQGSSWGTQNTRQSYWAASSDLTGFADGWGGGTGVQGWFLEAFGENTNPNSYDFSANSSFGDVLEGESGDERRPETFMMNGDEYPELLPDGYTYALDDPSSAYSGNATSLKKYVIGPPAVNDGRVGQQRTGIDTYMLRLAEIYLTYAQTFVAEGGGSTSNSEALQYYNVVRERADLDPDEDGTLTHAEVFMEKWRELAFEGQTWFMLVRWHEYQPEAAKQFIREQRRGYTVSYNSSGEILVTEPGDYEPLQVPDNPNNRAQNVFLLPYPEQDLLQNDLMDEPPEEYDFSDQGAGSSE